MWQELQVWHSTKKNAPVEAPLLWRTCLRQILFLSPHQTHPPLPEGEFYTGPQAHRFLVEICAGLHSPLVGETEVFGQFRAFREEANFPALWNSFLDAVEADAKKIRRESLIGIGSQSYGSLARSFLESHDTVILVGGGHLAKELLPWVSNNKIYHLARNPAQRAQEFAAIPALPEAVPPHAVWLIAAPFKNEILRPKMQSAKTVLDFRGEFSFSGELPFQYRSLENLFSTLQSYRDAAEEKRKSALQRAWELSEARAHAQRLAAVHRPFGWEDAFA